MPTLTCPKCRQGMPDDALDVGQCPACGFPIDGPLEFGKPGARSAGTRALIALGVVALLGGAGYASYAYFNRPENPTPELADRGREPAREPAVPVLDVAPFPHEPKSPGADPGTAPHTKPDPTPAPVEPPGGNKGQPPMPPVAVPPVPPVVEPPPKRDGPRPIPARINVNPKIEPNRHFDNPDDIVSVPDLNRNDRVVLTGRVRVLKLSQVHGKGVVDASGLVAEEVEITGDLNSEATVTVNAPGGKVTLRGWVAGSTKLTIRAPGGEVVLAQSGRFTNGSTVTLTTKRFEALGLLTGSTKVNVTFTAGGALKLTRTEEGATVTYRKTGANEPAPVIDRGDVRGGAKVMEGK